MPLGAKKNLLSFILGFGLLVILLFALTIFSPKLRNALDKYKPFFYIKFRFLINRTSIISASAAIMTNSGDIFGPPVSTSKNLIIPREELGPCAPGPLVNLTIVSL